MRFAHLAFLPVLALTQALAQPPAQELPPQEFKDPLVLLQAVARSYAADVDSFRLQAIAETEQNNDLQREWRKTYRTVLKGPGALYRIETRAPYGSFIQVSDGATEWIYLVEVKMYVKHPLPQDWPHLPKVVTGGAMELRSAWDMRMQLESEAAGYDHAEMLPQETIAVESRSYPCYVVHVTSADKSHQQNKDFHSDSTYWIDKTALVFRKKVEHSDTFIIVTPSVHVPFHMDSTTVYPVADFNPRTTAADFSFTPPPDAKEVATLEPEYTGHAVQHPEAEMVGQPAPALTLVADDAGKVELSSFRGKPLLLEFWATWCGPCLAAMPAFNRLYAELREKGVSVVTIDQDAVPADATAYLARHGYAWPNYHDTDKQIGKAYKAFKGVGGIPTVVLMDAQGKIAYEETGMDEPALRKAIAALGPEYASVAPRDAEKPAPAAKANEH